MEVDSLASVAFSATSGLENVPGSNLKSSCAMALHKVLLLPRPKKQGKSLNYCFYTEG